MVERMELGRDAMSREKRKTSLKDRAFGCILCVVICASVLFSGCDTGARRSGIFDYASGSLSGEILLSCNGFESSFDFERKDGKLEICFEYPDELSGFRICSQDGKLTVNYGELSVDAPAALSVIPNIVSEMFSLSEDMITDIGTRSENGETLTVVSARDITVTFTADGVPVRMEGVADGRSFKAEIRSLGKVG